VTITLTPIPTVRLYRTRFFEADVWEGGYPTDDVRTEDFDCRDEPVEDAVRVIQREGLTFAATGNAWAAHPDGTQIIDYGTGQREEVTAHLLGFTARQCAAIVEQVG
jgi:hypothetical protein